MKQPTSDGAALERARADLKAAFEDIDRLASGQRELESQLAARFVEVAALTRIAQRAEDERDVAVEAQKLAIQRAENDRDAAVEARESALGEAAATRAELGAATAAFATEGAALRAEIDGLRQTAARRYHVAVLTIIDSAPWRWLPGRLRAAALAPLLRRTGLIDEEWYVSQHADVAARGLDPVRHFIAYGAKEGRSPNRDAAVDNGGDRVDRTKTDL